MEDLTAMTKGAVDTDTDTGFAEIDGEHRVQIGLLTAFRDAVVGARERNQVEEILDQLVDYSKVHFMSEQLLMRLYEYPDYEKHVSEHDWMLEQIEDMQKGFRDGDRSITEATANTLIDGLVGHIKRTDRVLGTYLGEINPHDPHAG